jgi:hypothetical protein
MSHAPEEKLLASLPSEVREPLEAAFALLDKGENRKASDKVRDALGAAAFPHDDGTGLAPANELTPSQRSLAEILAHRPTPHSMTYNGFRMPGEAWGLRRWLGLATPGALEEKHGGQLLWQALVQATFRDATPKRLVSKEKVGKLLALLPVAKRLEAYGLIALGAYKFATESLPPFPGLDEVDGSHGPLAQRLAAEIPDQREWSTLGPSEELRVPLCRALLLAGVPIQPEWDAYVPLENTELAKEWLAALPEPRRAKALIEALEHVSESWVYTTNAALALLPSLPSRELLEWFVGAAQEADGESKEELGAQLANAIAGHPELAEAAAPLVGKRKEPKKLTLKHALHPASIEELSPSQRQQFAIFELPDSDVVWMDWLDVYEGEELVYDLVLHNQDYGGVYEPGDVYELVTFSQGGVSRADDGELAERIEAALASFKWPNRR